MTILKKPADSSEKKKERTLDIVGKMWLIVLILIVGVIYLVLAQLTYSAVAKNMEKLRVTQYNIVKEYNENYVVVKIYINLNRNSSVVLNMKNDNGVLAQISSNEFLKKHDLYLELPRDQNYKLSFDIHDEFGNNLTVEKSLTTFSGVSVK